MSVIRKINWVKEGSVSLLFLDPLPSNQYELSGYFFDTVPRESDML